ncbi:unnamed protein product [Candida verbasci]|uniref:SP-RING-type domain-containing protein n=1 Tax=Candida verbasci TaxID=1227364 RepID=A0A9W4TW14_9ASCO|nr:unnamed protein product [Candida verbasci]
MSESEYLPSKLSLPTYVPLQRTLVKEYESLFQLRTTQNLLQQQKKQITEHCDNYINFVLDNDKLDFDENILTNCLNTFENLVESNNEIEKLKSIQDHPDIKKFASREENDCKLETLDSFHNITNDQFPDIIKQKHTDALVQADFDFHKFLKNVLFVIKKPEDQLIEEEEDDGLAISGGKVSLKDPLTLDYYREPYKSLKCNHIFEKSSILANLRPNQIKQCPIEACDSSLSINDLVLDKLMVIRIRSFKRMERKDDADIEAVV